MSGDRDAMVSMYQHGIDVRNKGLPGESTEDWGKKDHRSEKDLPDEPVVLTEDQLVRDDNFQQLASTVYDHFNPSQVQIWTDEMIATAVEQGVDEARIKRLAFRSNRTEEENPQEKEEWLASHYGWFNGNITAMAWDWNKLSDAPKDLQQSWAQGYLLYDATPTTRKQVGRATVAAVLDVPNLLGFSLLAKGAAKGLSGMAVRGKIHQMAIAGLKSNAFIGGAEGLSYGAVFPAATESLLTKGIEDHKFDWSRVGYGTAIGAVIGTGLGWGIGKLAEKAPGWIDKGREVATDIDMTDAPTNLGRMVD